MPFVQKRAYAKSKIKVVLFLEKTFGLSHLEAKRSIDKGRVFCNQKQIHKKGTCIQGEVLITLFEANKQVHRPIFETSEFAIFDKPSKVLVHPPRITLEHTLLDDARALFGKDANFTHRIDKETSGLIIASKNKKAESFFKLAFEAKKIKKSYLAFVRGEIKKNILIDAPIIKFRNLSTNFSPIQKNGKEAKTHIIPIKYDSDKNITFIKAVPLTGRTHQIRIHLWHIGHPILGDPIYGQNETFRTKYIEKKITNTQRVLQTGANRLLLHAYSLEFEFKNKFFFVSKQNFNIV